MAKKKATSKSKITDAFLKRYCNLVRDQIDPRDRPFMAFGVDAAAPTIPKKVDHSPQTKPVGNQGNTGSCVGWAAAYGLRRWLHHKQTGVKKKFSVRFTWMTSKEIDQWIPNVPFELSGTKIRDAFKVMNKYGCASDNLWPFSQQLPNPLKEKAILSDAMKYRIGNYHALTTNVERRVHLAKQGPFVVGVPVYSNWSSMGPDAVIPNPGGMFRGGHAVLVVGYDDQKKLFKLQNSWDTTWGKAGYGYFTYDYMEKHSWSSWGAEQL